MRFYFSKKDNQVKMYSDSEIKVDTSIFGVKEINPTQAELQRINDNDVIYIKGNKLEFQDNPFKIKANKLQEIDKAKDLTELKEIIKEIIN